MAFTVNPRPPLPLLPEIKTIEDARLVLHTLIMNHEYPELQVSLPAYKIAMEYIFEHHGAISQSQRMDVVRSGKADATICGAIGVDYKTGNENVPF